VPTRLKRYYGNDDLHFITFSCYRRRPFLGTPRRRTAFLRVLEQTRVRYRFVVVGYIVMPEHVHLLISEPQHGDPSLVMQVLKQRVARRLLRHSRKRSPEQSELFPSTDAPALARFWQRRFFDFNVWSAKKVREKLRYMHRNPVKRGLVASPELWAWSSFSFYAQGEQGIVAINEVFDATGNEGDSKDES
jgi:putative transposase